MDANIHTLESCGEALLEPVVMSLRPLLSITRRGCSRNSSFIRHQQEVYELVHADDQGEDTGAHGHVHHQGNSDQHNAQYIHEGDQDRDGYIHTNHGPASQHPGHAHTHVREHAVYHLGQDYGNEHVHYHHEHEHVYQHGEDHTLHDHEGHDVYIGHAYVHRCIEEGEVDKRGRLGHAHLQCHGSGHEQILQHGTQVPNDGGGRNREGGHDYIHGHDHENDLSIHAMPPDTSTDDLDSMDRPTMLDSLPKGRQCKIKSPSTSELMSTLELQPLLPPNYRCNLKQPKSGTDNGKRMEFSDEVNAVEDEELQPNVKAMVATRNLACTERRRRKSNERISTDIQKQDNYNWQYDILSPQTDHTNALVQDTCVKEASSTDCASRGTDSENLCDRFPIHRILELNVSKLEENLYHLKLRCRKSPRVLIQLTRALDALNFNFIHANIDSMGDHILNTIVFKVLSHDEFSNPRELEEKIVEVVHMFGLQF